MLLSYFVIVGHSMEPSFKNGSFVLISSIPYLFVVPKVGDTIAFQKEDKVFVKRVTKINGEKYFVKGDNEKDSMDSRRLGWIKRKEIVGKVIYRKS
jgi:signal peptidase I